MSKQCAKCTKTVFPVEELKCLDKVWHKGCFRCQECNMSLNMKNYKGYNKLPYCNAHYPKTTHTVVAETPETRRIAENTKIQSNVKYHAEFEKSKGAKISIADDPETKRVRKNMETISNISYHGDLQKRNQMEMNRPVEQDDHVSRRRPGSTGDYEPRGRQPGSINDYDPTANQGGTPYSQRQSQGTAVYDSRTGVVQNGSHGRKVGSISDYDPVNEKYGSIAGQYSGYQQQASPPPPPPPQEDPVPQYNPVEVPPPHMDEEPSTTYTPPVTSDEEPPQTTPQPVPTAEEQIDTTVPISSADSSAEKDAISAQEEDPKMEIHFATPVRMTQTNQIPSMINNLPPTYAPQAPPTEEAASPSDDCPPSYNPPAPPSNDPPTSPNEETISQSNDCPPQYDPPPPPTEEVMDRSEDFSSPEDLAGSSQPQQARQPAYQPPPQQQQQQPYRPPGQPQRNQVKYKAMYDYTAADDDEVSFREDDYIVNCEIIDAGWMEGTVERTGQRGMLPSNYVEKCS